MRAQIFKRLFAIIVVMVAGAVPAQKTFAEQLTVVELFTSHACATCQPAEAYIKELSRRDDVLALAFHVDYWNYTGRVDPFANPMFSNRQRKYSERFGLVYLASPYFVVDGRWQSEGSNSLPIRDFLNSKKEITLSEPDIELADVREDLIRIYVGPSPIRKSADVFVVHFDRRRSTTMKLGDIGELLVESFNVVRSLVSVAVYVGEPIEIFLPVSFDGDRPDFTGLFVQEFDQGSILTAALLRRN